MASQVMHPDESNFRVLGKDLLIHVLSPCGPVDLAMMTCCSKHIRLVQVGAEGLLVYCLEKGSSSGGPSASMGQQQKSFSGRGPSASMGQQGKGCVGGGPSGSYGQQLHKGRTPGSDKNDKLVSIASYACQSYCAEVTMPATQIYHVPGTSVVAALHLGRYEPTQNTRDHAIRLFDVATQSEVGVIREIMDRYTFACLSPLHTHSSATNASATGSSATPQVLVAGSVHSSACEHCAWEYGPSMCIHRTQRIEQLVPGSCPSMVSIAHSACEHCALDYGPSMRRGIALGGTAPSMCIHRTQARSAVLCMLDLRSPTYMVACYNMQYVSIIPRRGCRITVAVPRPKALQHTLGLQVHRECKCKRHSSDIGTTGRHQALQHTLGLQAHPECKHYSTAAASALQPELRSAATGEPDGPESAVPFVLGPPQRSCNHQGLYLACNDDVLVGRAENGMVWKWDLAATCGWGGQVPSSVRASAEGQEIHLGSWHSVGEADASACHWGGLAVNRHWPMPLGCISCQLPIGQPISLTTCWDDLCMCLTAPSHDENFVFNNPTGDLDENGD
eukprot:gene5257-18489_t